MAKYSELSEEEKDKLAQKMAKELNFAFYKQASSDGGFARGTDEKRVSLIANEIRKAGIEGGSDLVNRISSAKDQQGKSYFAQDGGTLRQALIKEYSFGDKDDILNAFGYSKHSNLGRTDQELIAQKGEGGVNTSNFKQFNRVASIDDFPEDAGSWIPNVTETEQDFSEFYDLGFKPTKEETFTPPKEGDQDFKGPPRPTPKTGTSGSTPNPQKVNALQAAKNLYQYEGGEAQAKKDQALLRSTRLGMREADGGFRLRTRGEVAARNREGRAIINEPKAQAMKNFRNRYGDGAGGSRLEQERKQFEKDTGMEAEATERMTRAGEEAVALQRQRQQRQKTLEKYRVKEPEPFGKEVAALNEKDQARVMALVNKREEEMMKKKKPVR